MNWLKVFVRALAWKVYEMIKSFVDNLDVFLLLLWWAFLSILAVTLTIFVTVWYIDRIVWPVVAKIILTA